MLHIEIKKLPQAQSALQTLHHRATHLAPLLQTLAHNEEARIQKRFESQRAPDGKLWASLKTRTGQPLHATGALMQSFQTQVKTHGTHGTMLVGTPTPYATFHQFGTKHTPARPFLGIYPEWEQEAFAAVRHHLGVQ